MSDSIWLNIVKFLHFLNIMGDKFQRQYDYKANSNLVLPTDTSLIEKNREGTGEVESLAGRLSGRMGDRAGSHSSIKREERDKKRVKSELKKFEKDERANLNVKKNLSIADIDIKDLIYQPKSDRTTIVYGLIIKFVRRMLGFEHSSAIDAAADEVISTMKNPKLTEDLRRLEVARLLSDDEKICDDDFNEISNLCKRIDDWYSSNTEQYSPQNHEDCVNVIFEDEDEAPREDDYLSEVRDSEDEPDLDEMFDKAENELLNIKHSTIVPKIDMGEPIRKEGYQEYHVEPKQRPSYRREDFIRIDELCDDEKKVFSEIKELNYIQSKVYKKAFKSDRNLLVCAPTGAGKTNIALFAMLREVLKCKRTDGSIEYHKFKIIYIAPIKALVQEIVQNFRKRLKSFDIIIEELTGDHQLDQRQISQAQIIVCTPEKWDIITRKSIDRLYTKLVRLVIFDEIHLLHNERGATLEALVARIKRHKKIEGEPIRIIGLSATLPNYKEVAKFISPTDSIEDSTCYFDSSHRPIPLRQQYIAIMESKKAVKIVNEVVYTKVIERLLDNSQILIFVHSRPDTLKTAEYIKTRCLDEDKADLLVSSQSAREVIDDYGADLRPKLRELLQFGLGIHHAGMSRDDRGCVEELFRKRYIKVLVSTATLAWGVNLPARTVIIKGTQVYRDGKWTDLDSLDVTQMLGRAGRPGFDTLGEGIVITQQNQVSFYMSLMTEQLPVESRLISRLPEFINAECVIGNIESLRDAVDWLSETYLYSRMRNLLDTSNERQYLSSYGLNNESKRNDPDLLIHRRNLAHTAINTLDNRGLVIFDRASGNLKSTELGRIASHYNCTSKTMKLFYDSIHEHTSDIELIRTFSQADEFKDIFVRRGEETDLQTLINQVPFPIDDKRATPGANKVNALLQVYIFRMNIEGSELICDMHFIKDNAARLARAIHEIVLLKGYAMVSELSFDLCRKIDKRMTICHSPLRQFADEINMNLISRLERKTYRVDELRILKPDKLSELLRCDRSQGDMIARLLKLLPKFKIEASVKPISKNLMKIDLSLYPDFEWSDEHHGYSERVWLMVEDVDQDVLLYYETIYIRKFSQDDEIRTSFIIPYMIPAQPFYYLRILPDNWFGCDHHLPIHLEKLTLPDDSLILTQPLDLEPLPITSLNDSQYESIYDHRFKGASFNQIQTQTFKYFYQSDEDIILLAAAGSGKTTCAELAVIRAMKAHTKPKVAFIAPNEQASEVIYDSWSKLFGAKFGIYILTGNHRIDSAKVDTDSVNIVVGDATQWHSLILVRSKKYRKLMNKFKLYIIDDIHTLCDDKFSTLEWVCSKIRIMTKLNEDPVRLIALGSPMVAAESVKNWLAYERGSKEPLLFNYPPGIRPVKLDISVQKFHYYDYKMRLLTMERPVYRLITGSSKGRPVMIFVSDYHQALSLSDVILGYARSEGIRLSGSSTRSGKIRSRTLEEYTRYGIGIVYRGMDSDDKVEIVKLFDKCDLRVLIVTVGACWSISCRSYLTIIMDTQHHDGIIPTDYNVSDIMHMVGLTGRPLSDHDCKCIIMCHYSKAESYERLLREPLPAESDLPVNLIALVNYEVASGLISELNNIYKPYLAHTFFYKRISINPNYYGLVAPEDPDQKTRVYGTFFNDLVNKVALDLEKNEFLTIEGSSENPLFSPGLISKISLEYHISFETLSSYVQWLTEDDRNYEVRPIELIELIATCTYEFSTIIIRHNELPILKDLQRRHKPSGDERLQDYGQKVKLLILSQYQKSDGNEMSLGGELANDQLFIATFSYKLLMAIVDVAWLKDSFSLAKASIQLAKKMVLFRRSTKPNIDMDVSLSKESDIANFEVSITREDDPFSEQEFNETYKLPLSTYRDEGWCFLILGKSKSQDGPEKFSLFKRVKAPTKGSNTYKLSMELSSDNSLFLYDLYFMSDFYSTKEDRRVTALDLN